MMQLKDLSCIIFLSTFIACTSLQAQELYKAPPPGTQTRWVSPENPTGGKGQGGQVNKGAKGNAFYSIMPGEKKVIFDVEGAGTIKRIWISGTIPITPEQRRSVRIDMFWDNAPKAAVSAPIGDFFGVGLGLISSFENDLFGSPEGRSYNCTIPMPFRKAARIEITNESSSYVLLWYDIDFLKLTKQEKDMLYFHAHWNRTPQTQLGKDFEILPYINGMGRFLGCNIGVIGNPDYRHTWFGEGEVKIYLDGDHDYPTLVGTGTEDYIGSGWGQGRFYGPYHGSLVADTAHDVYAFYRYHIIDPVYFTADCRVTIQQIGNASLTKFKELVANKAVVEPVWIFDPKGLNDTSHIRSNGPQQIGLLDLQKSLDLNSSNVPTNVGVNFYRSDDLSATAYFYLDKPSDNLPDLPPVAFRMKDLKSKVWSYEGAASK